MLQPPTIRKKALGSVFEIGESKVDEPKKLVALRDANLVYGLRSIFTFRWCDPIARGRGRIDRVSNG